MWNKAAIAKHFWALANKQDRLWIRWIHAYYVKHHDVWHLPIPQRLSWAIKKNLSARDLVTDANTLQQYVHNHIFSIKKLYWYLKGDSPVMPQRRIICKSKASPKALFITWLMLHGRLTTKARLAQWEIGDNQDCVMCNGDRETQEHMFSTAITVQRFGLYVYSILE